MSHPDDEEDITARPASLPTETIGVKTGCGNAFVTTSLDPKFFELAIILGKSGNCVQGLLEALATCITLMRRAKPPIARRRILRALNKIRCPSDSVFLKSCPQAIHDVLAAKWFPVEDEKEAEKEEGK